MKFRFKEHRVKATNNFSSLFDVFCEEFDLKSELSIEKLKEEWQTIVGPILATHVDPLKIENQTLFLSSDHSVFSNDIVMMKGTIIESISRLYSGTISDIRVITKRRRV